MDAFRAKPAIGSELEKNRRAKEAASEVPQGTERASPATPTERRTWDPSLHAH
jgi:hypothetical protein